MGNSTTRSTGSIPNLMPMETDAEHILQSASSLSFRMVYKHSGIETQRQETVNTLEHALAVNDERHFQNTVPVNDAADPPLV